MQRYIVQPCDTLFGISHRYGVTLTQLLTVNPQVNILKQIFIGQILNIPNNTYTVRPGDTLNKIAQHFRVPLNLLISSNPQILYQNHITVGQIINIPSVAPPKQLEVVESNSEDIMDDINNNDWVKAQNKVNQIKLSMNELKPILATDSIPTNLIDGITAAILGLEKEVADKKIYESKVQANQITKYVPDISDYYKVELPTDLGRLDYLCREISLNADVKDWVSAVHNFEKSKGIWNNLKSKLSLMYKNDADKYQSSMDKLIKDINQKDVALVKKEANILLDMIDVLETDFTKQITR